VTSAAGRLRAPDPRDPTTIGPYQVLALIGEGGMGRVYLASSAAGRLAAVKVVSPEVADDPVFRERFRREVATAKRIAGAFTAPVADADPAGPRPWLATQYVPGPSLRDAVERIGPLPLDACLMLGARMLEALMAVHQDGFAHRDLKPSNVLLAADGPRLIDFGIARAADQTALTRAGEVFGTAAYMSPEQAMGAPVGPACDVFAFALVLVFASTGRDPFGAGDPAALLFRIVHDEPDLRGVPATLRDRLRPCLAKDPADRPTPGALLPAFTADLGPSPAWPAPVAELVREHEAEIAAWLPAAARAPAAVPVAADRPAGSPAPGRGLAPSPVLRPPAAWRRPALAAPAPPAPAPPSPLPPSPGPPNPGPLRPTRREAPPPGAAPPSLAPRPGAVVARAPRSPAPAVPAVRAHRRPTPEPGDPPVAPTRVALSENGADEACVFAGRRWPHLAAGVLAALVAVLALLVLLSCLGTVGSDDPGVRPGSKLGSSVVGVVAAFVIAAAARRAVWRLWLAARPPWLAITPGGIQARAAGRRYDIPWSQTRAASVVRIGQREVVAVWPTPEWSLRTPHLDRPARWIPRTHTLCVWRSPGLHCDVLLDVHLLYPATAHRLTTAIAVLASRHAPHR